MIEEACGNILEDEVEALVNTVNCVGFMGKGIALQFKQAFPSNFEAYKKACKAGEVVPGKMFVHPAGRLVGAVRYIINFPTKRHWRAKSRLEDIERGLVALVETLRDLEVRSVAIPALGCGLGGLSWDQVRPLIETALAGLPEVTVRLYAPQAAPRAEDRPIRTSRPKMTVARALFIKLMERYQGLQYRLTLLEIQKLAYFLQQAGEPLRLRYSRGPYGPYAENLNKVLENIEGHFTQGYDGSRKPDQDISLLSGAVEEADSTLEPHAESRRRLEKVSALIEGFETPYGMEMLASVHWVANQEDDPARDPEGSIARVHAWNERKREVFRPNHLTVAWKRLASEGWLPVD